MSSRHPRDHAARKSEYAQKLRDPRWQRKRLGIMQRDEFTCQKCMASDQTLNVHHCYYEFGRDPWDYPDESLVTLCEGCHQEETERLKMEKALLMKTLGEKGLLADDYFALAYAFDQLRLQHQRDVSVAVIAWSLENACIHQLLMDLYFAHKCKVRISEIEPDSFASHLARQARRASDQPPAETGATHG